MTRNVSRAFNIRGSSDQTGASHNKLDFFFLLITFLLQAGSCSSSLVFNKGECGEVCWYTDEPLLRRSHLSLLKEH